MALDERRRRETLARRRRQQVRRRRLGALGVLVLVVGGALAAFSLAGSGSGSSSGPVRSTATATTDPGTTAAPTTTAPVVAVAHPGTAKLVFTGPTDRRRVALTFDDGFCERCIGSILQTLADTGTKATLFPNGIYAQKWLPHAAEVRRLVAAGQLDLGNHTWSHNDTRQMTAATFKTELERNDAWLQKTFGASSLPVFRPPFGTYNRTVLKRSGTLGYTTVVTWSGGSRDWEGLSADAIVKTVHDEAGPGVIYLLHPNYPTTAAALPRIIRDLTDRGYEIVTLRELLGLNG